MRSYKEFVHEENQKLALIKPLKVLAQSVHKVKVEANSLSNKRQSYLLFIS